MKILNSTGIGEATHHGISEQCFFDSLLIASANLDGEKQQNIFELQPIFFEVSTMECN